MKKFIIPAMILVVLCLTTGTSQAEPITWRVEVESLAVLNVDTSYVNWSAGPKQYWTKPMFVGYDIGNYTFSAAITDTNSGAGNASDSIEVQLWRCPSSDIAETGAGWGNSPVPLDSLLGVKVLTLNPLSTAKAARRLFARQSVDIDSAAVIAGSSGNIGGWMRARIVEGTADHATNKYDTMAVPYTLRIMLECKGRE